MTLKACYVVCRFASAPALAVCSGPEYALPSLHSHSEAQTLVGENIAHVYVDSVSSHTEALPGRSMFKGLNRVEA